MQAFSTCRKPGLLSRCGAQLLLAVSSLVAELGLSMGSVAVMPKLSFTTACGIFPGQELKLSGECMLLGSLSHHNKNLE